MSKLQIEINNFYFVFQPIFRVDSTKTPQLLKYELLTRSHLHQGFPFQVFQEASGTQGNNALLMEWYFAQISLVLDENNFAFGFNLDPQQLRFPETLTMLKKIVASYDVSQVTVEVTEHYYQNVADMEKEINQLVTTVQEIKRLGFQIAFDDVSSGLNDFGLVAKCLGFIDTIKLSLLSFKELSFEEFFWIIQTWQKIAREHHLRFIVEGIDTPETYNFMIENGIIHHQGFLFGLPLQYQEVH